MINTLTLSEARTIAYDILFNQPSDKNSDALLSVGDGNKTIYEVRIPKASDKFEPALLKIKVGDSVKWVNDDDRGHPIASIPGQSNDKELFSKPIPPGGSWSHTFMKAGEFPYFCYIHYVMMGAVIVEEVEKTPPAKTE